MMNNPMQEGFDVYSMMNSAEIKLEKTQKVRKKL